MIPLIKRFSKMSTRNEQDKMSKEAFPRYDKEQASLLVSEPEVLGMADARPTARGGPEFSSLTSGSEVGCEYTGTMEGGLEKGESSVAEERPAERAAKNESSSMASFSETPFFPTSPRRTAARDVKFVPRYPWQQAQAMYEQRERKQRIPQNKNLVDLSHQYVPPAHPSDNKTDQYGTILHNTLATLVDKLQSLAKMHGDLEDAQDILSWRQNDVLQDQRRVTDAQKNVVGALQGLGNALQVQLEEVERVSGRIDGVKLE